MARTESLLMKGARGKIGRDMVFKQHGQNTLITKYPKNTGKNRKLSPKQMAYAELMEEAAWYASGTRKDPTWRAEALLRLDVTSKKLYHALVAEYIREHKAEKLANPEKRSRSWHKRQFSKKEYKY